ncbi:ATP-binding protein [Gemmatimonas sp.]|uniref:ATP-binding protein n=1 Tax=Gemmatimonas sp. TaxID=1962908 RepID=UPI0037BE7404
MPDAFRATPVVDIPAIAPPAMARGLGLRARLMLMVLVALLPPTIIGAFVRFDGTGPSRQILLVVSMLLSLGLAYAMASLVVRALESLIADAHALAAGVSGHRSVVRSTDEIGQLAVALNQMAETVERRNAALADNERRYRFLFDSNPLPMWAWDAETMNILAVNEAAIDRYGYGRDAFLSLKIVDLLDASELPRFSGARLPFSESRQNAGTWIHRTSDGRAIEMEITTTSSRRLGRASWLSVGIDVTARRQAERALARSEEQLRQSQKMEAIGTFAGGISHDFNNLLTGMLGYCDLILAQMPKNAAHREDLNEIRALALRGTELSRQILSVSRRQMVQPTTLDPNAVVRDLDRLLRRVIGENIELVTHLDEQVGTVHADMAQLEQALLNLVSNARDAMPQGGRLTIETAALDDTEVRRLRLDQRLPWMAIRVRDDGVGMDETVRQHIFEPFFTTKPKGKGSGLGLALASNVMDQSGGEIRVDSEVGHGTTMHLLLPRRTDAVVPLPAIEEDPELLNGQETVLLTEDEDAVRTVAVAALERRGYRVLAAADGEAALALSRAFAGRIDLLVTDVVMPGMNGRELADRLTQARPGLPVLYVSGYTEDTELVFGLAGESRSLLPKPFTSLELARRVRSSLDTAAKQSERPAAAP